MIADSNFYRKIMDKYQRKRRIPFRFPLMLFRKNSGHAFCKRIHLGIEVNMHFDNRQGFSPLRMKAVESLKKVYAFHGAGRLSSQISSQQKFFSKSTGSVEKVIRRVFASRFFPAERLSISRISPAVQVMQKDGTRTDERLFSIIGVDYHSPAFTVDHSSVQMIGRGRVFHLFFNNVNKYSLQGYKTFYRFLSSFQQHVLLKHVPNMFSREMEKLFLHRFFAGFHKAETSPVARMYETTNTSMHTHLSRHNNVSSRFFLRYSNDTFPHAHLYRAEQRYILQKNNGDFHFSRRRAIGKEVEEMKKMIVEIKKAMPERSSSPQFPVEAMKKYVDVNLLSDQVYQHIERRIRIERERRGL